MSKRAVSAPVRRVQPYRVKTDPRPRRHGRCYVCGGERPPVAVEHQDPFCRSDCCRTYYELQALAKAGS